MKLVVFDFDGTLADGRKLILESHRIIFGEFRLPQPSHERSLALIGRSLELVLLELAGPSAPVQEMRAAYSRVLPELRAGAFAETPFAGASELLAELSARSDVKLAIATGHVMLHVVPALDRFGWTKFFSTIQTADKAPSKPHPGMLLQAMAETGIDPAQTVMIGDTSFDMEMACAAEVRGIGVAWGFHTQQQLDEAGAGLVVHTMDELRQYLIA